MSYYNHATEIVLQLNQFSKPRQLRNFEREEQAAALRALDQTNNAPNEQTRRAITLLDRLSKLFPFAIQSKPRKYTAKLVSEPEL